MYHKKENEDDLSYLIRLCCIKIEKNPNDLDWEDIVDLTGLNVHRDTLRKAMNQSFGGYAIHKYYEKKQDNFSKEKQELEKLKLQYQDQKREYRKHLRADSKFDHIKEEISKAIDRLPKFNFKNNYISDNGICEASLLLSDWHYGIKNNNHWNKFDVNIANQRANLLKNKVVKYCKRHNVSTLHIEIIGDMVNGGIHLSSKVENEEDVVTQVMGISELLSTFIFELSNELENTKIKVYTLYGNHGRITPNKKESIDVENFERLIEWYLNIRFKNSNQIEVVKNTIDETFGLYTLKNNKNIVFSHGNYDKIQNAIKNYSQLLKIFVDEVHLGHFHNYNEKDEYGSSLVINGTFSGTDTYAKNLRLSGKPLQVLRIYDNDDTCTYKISLNTNE